MLDLLQLRALTPALRRTIATTIVLAMSLVLLLPSAGSASAAGGAVSGFAYYENDGVPGYDPTSGDQPIVGATVTVDRDYPYYAESTTTDSAGAYQFTGLPNGSYFVVVEGSVITGLNATTTIYNLAVNATSVHTGQNLGFAKRAKAVNDTVTVPWNSATPVDVVDNDTKQSRGTVTITDVTTPSHGTATTDGAQTIYTPTAGYVGPDSFEYTITDFFGVETTASVSVTVEQVAVAAPTAMDDTARVGATLGGQNIPVLANDQPAGAITLQSIVTDPTRGNATIDGDNIRYTPGTAGADSLRYRIVNESGQSEADVQIEVVPAPTAGALSRDIPAELPYSVDLSALVSGSAPQLTDAAPIGPGSVSLQGMTVTFTPTVGFTGQDGFDYTITDDLGQSGIGRVTLTVIGRPAPVDDPVTISADTPVTIEVLANDVLPYAAHGSTVTIATQAQHGNAVVGAQGVVTYTPAAGYIGPDTVKYQVTDALGQTGEAWLTLNVVAGAAAADDTAEVAATGSVLIPVLANDSPADATIAEVVADPEQGAVLIEGEAIRYTPNAGANGIDSFRYRITHPTAGSAEATVIVTVVAPPVAESVTIDVPATRPTTIDLSGSLTGRAPLTVTATTTGTFALDGLTVTYTPAENSAAEDVLPFTVRDGLGQSAAGTLTVRTVPGPIAVDDPSATTVAGAPVDVAVLDNDELPTAETAWQPIVSLDPAHGTAVVAVDGRIRYTPAPDFVGTDTFEYTVTGELDQSSTATVTVTVAAATVAQDDTAMVGVTGTVLVPVLANDAPADVSLVGVVVDPAQGHAVIEGNQIRYTPTAEALGTDSFRYRISHPRSGPAEAEVMVTIVPQPMAVPLTLEVPAGAPTTVDIAGQVTGGTALTVALVPGQQLTGTAILDGTVITYTPGSGTDAIRYIVTDAVGQSVGGTVTVTVVPGPAAADDTARVARGFSVDIETLGNDVVPVPSRTDVALDTQGTLGQVALGATPGIFRYTAPADFTGTDTFRYTLTDHLGQGSEAAVTVTVTDGVAANDDQLRLKQGTSGTVTLDVLLNDTPGTGLTLDETLVTEPLAGTAVVDGDHIVYTPPLGASGSDEFTYRVHGPDGSSDTATVWITFVAPPTVPAVTATIPQGGAAQIDVLAQATGESLSVSAPAVTGAGAAVTINADGVVSYQSAPGFTGTDSFPITVTDDLGQATLTTVTVIVIAPPLAVDDVVEPIALGAAVSIDVLANDSVVAGVPVTVSRAADPVGGQLTFEGAVVTYQANPGFSGADEFRYAITDGYGQSSTARVTVTVLAPPTVPDLAVTIGTQGTATFDLASTVTGSGVTFAADMVTANGGTVTLNDGVLTYTAPEGFSGEDTVVVTVTDQLGQSGTGTIAVTVVAAPTISDLAMMIGQESSATVDVASATTGEGLTFSAPELTDQGGTVSIIDGVLTYVPAQGFTGEDQVTITVTDVVGQTATATLTFTVVARPTLAEMAERVGMGGAVTVDLTAGSTGLDVTHSADPITANGAGVSIGSGVLTYVAAPGFVGVDTVVVTATDSLGQATTATLTVTVVAAPTLTSLTQVIGAGASTTVDLGAASTGSDVRFSAEELTESGGTVVIDGGMLTYTAAAGFTGVEVVTVTARDDLGQTVVATVTITVVAQPTAQDVTLLVPVDGSAGVDLATVLTGDGLELTVPPTTGAGASVAVAGTVVTYTAAPGHSGEDVIDVLITDMAGQTAAMRVLVTVVAAPTLSSVSATIGQDATVTFDLAAGATGRNVAFSVPALSAAGVQPTVVDGVLTYVAPSGFSGDDTIGLLVTDELGQTAAATATITVIAHPVATADAVTTGQETEVVVPVLANDLAWQPTLTAATIRSEGGDPAAIGEVLIVPAPEDSAMQGVAFTAAPEFAGEAVIDYVLTDGVGQVAEGTLTVTVVARPIAPLRTARIAERGSVSFALLDEAAPGVVVHELGEPGGGHVDFEASTGVLSYTAQGGFSGRDSFGYVLIDELGQTATGTVEVLVQAAPTTRGTRIVTAPGEPVEVDVVGLFEGMALTVDTVSAAGHGSAELTDEGLVRYLPQAGFVGTDTVTVTVTDDLGQHATVTIEIVVAEPPTDPGSSGSGGDDPDNDGVGAEPGNVNTGVTTAETPGPQTRVLRGMLAWTGLDLGQSLVMLSGLVAAGMALVAARARRRTQD